MYTPTIVDVPSTLAAPLLCPPGKVGTNRTLPLQMFDEMLPISREALLRACSENVCAISEVLTSGENVRTLLTDTRLSGLASKSPPGGIPPILRFDFLPICSGVRLTEVTSIPAPVCLLSEETLFSLGALLSDLSVLYMLVLSDRFRTAEGSAHVTDYVEHTSSHFLRTVCVDTRVTTCHYTRFLELCTHATLPTGPEVGVFVWADPRLLRERPDLAEIVESAIVTRSWRVLHSVMHSILVNNKALPLCLPTPAVTSWPETYALSGSTKEQVIRSREITVVKHRLSCEGEDVHFGKSYRPAEWRSFISHLLDTGAGPSYVAQAALEPLRYRFNGDYTVWAIEFYVYYLCGSKSHPTYAATARPLETDSDGFWSPRTELWRFVEVT